MAKAPSAFVTFSKEFGAGARGVRFVTQAKICISALPAPDFPPPDTRFFPDLSAPFAGGKRNSGLGVMISANRFWRRQRQHQPFPANPKHDPW